MRKRTFYALALIVAATITGVAPAWWVKGHETITEAAAMALPDDMPAFFRAAGKSLAYCAGDPDRWKNKGTPTLKDAESPHHFLDVEDLDGNAPPPGRYKALALMQKL